MTEKRGRSLAHYVCSLPLQRPLCSLAPFTHSLTHSFCSVPNEIHDMTNAYFERRPQTCLCPFARIIHTSINRSSGRARAKQKMGHVTHRNMVFLGQNNDSLQLEKLV